MPSRRRAGERDRAHRESTVTGRAYAAEVQARATGHHVELAFHRDDCKGGPTISMSHDDAAALMRTLQSAVDKAREREKRDITRVVETHFPENP